jgi:putative ATPase
LSVADILQVLDRAIHDERHGLGKLRLELDGGVLDTLAAISDGDARRALQLLEWSTQLAMGKSRENPDTLQL